MLFDASSWKRAKLRCPRRWCHNLAVYRSILVMFAVRFGGWDESWYRPFSLFQNPFATIFLWSLLYRIHFWLSKHSMMGWSVKDPIDKRFFFRLGMLRTLEISFISPNGSLKWTLSILVIGWFWSATVLTFLLKFSRLSKLCGRRSRVEWLRCQGTSWSQDDECSATRLLLQRPLYLTCQRKCGVGWAVPWIWPI